MEQLAAIVTAGVVTNLIVVSAPNSAWVLIPANTPVAIGWTWNGTVFAPPAAPMPTLAEAQAARIALMDSTYESLEHAPIAYMGTTFQADDYSQDLIAKTLVALGGATPANLGWWDINNIRVLMTNAQLQGLGQAIFARNQPLYINKQTKKAAIRAALTAAAVEAIVW